ncbi:hypothetical protein APSETT444_010022 [Aspergillus pseudonomiae]
MGWVYNLDKPDPHSEIAQVIAVLLVFTIAALLAVALRFYIRIHTKRALWLDDYAALYSAIMTAGYCASSILQTRWGLGLHAEYFPTANVKQFSKIQYAGGPLYSMSLLGFKVSLLASYLRIGGFVKMYRTIIIVAIAAVVVNQIIFTFLFIFPCKPVALCCVFAIGFFVTIIQIIRIFTIARLKTYTDSKPVILWSIVEISLAVIIACVPTYGPYFRVFVSTISSYRRRPTGQDYPLTSGNRQTTRKNGLSTLGRDDVPEGLRPYDNSTPHTTTISSSKVSPDNDSEEHILGNPQGMFATVDDQERGIHKVMEVTVERN